MHDDTTGGDDQAQDAAPPRVIWKNDRPFVIDQNEPDGVIRVIPLKIVPDAFFRLGVHWALPDWVFDSPDIINSPPLQFLVLLNASIEQRREAVSALRDIRASLRATRSLVEDGVGRTAAINLIDDTIKRVGALASNLDI